MNTKKPLSLIVRIVVPVLLLCIGFALGRNVEVRSPGISPAPEGAVREATIPSYEAKCYLAISLTKTNNENTTSFTAEETGGNFNQCLFYKGVTDVTIDINGITKKLEDALKDGDITEEEVFLLARMDARAGNCEESVESLHGVSHFTYHYPDFDLRLIYDVLEAPNGKQYLISDMLLYCGSDSYKIAADTDFTDPETGLRLDTEDWGLAFELVDATDSGITVSCTQSGGQQIGQLVITDYTVYTYGKEQLDNGNAMAYSMEIPMDGSCQFTIDWSETYGTLASGNYRLNLWVSDNYDASQIHPLMDNFRDWYVFDVEFTIP